jgi:uncharacterized repeat protein (TIGR01451 family)
MRTGVTAAVLFLSCLAFAEGLSADTFETGSYVIDMGQPTQTVGNALKPYGLVFSLVNDFRVPVAWAINPAKTTYRLNPGDPIPVDFTATITTGTKSYGGGSFLVRGSLVTPAVLAVIEAWRAQGVVVDQLAAPLTTNVSGVITSFPRIVLDAENGPLAVPYFENAGIPASPYRFGNPTDLSTCDDVFVLPDGDPQSWPVLWQQDLYNFVVSGGGAVWAGGRAPSEIEDVLISGTTPMNFLTNGGLVPWGSHSGGTPPYTYNAAAAGKPILQIMDRIDAATQNGPEQVYVPTSADWRSTTTVGVYDPDHPNNPPGGTAPFNDAAVLAYGNAFGNPSAGLVTYVAGRTLAGSGAASIAAQRTFFNFLLAQALARAPQPNLVVPTIVPGQPATLTATISGGSGSYAYQWISSAGGIFSIPAGTSTAGSPIATQYLMTATTDTIRLLVTDVPCGRQGVSSASVIVAPPTLDLDANDSSGATGADYQGMFLGGGVAAPAADTDVVIVTSGTTIRSAALALTARPDGASESLLIDEALAASSGIFVSPDGAGGLLLSGVATPAQYQAVIASLRYLNALASPSTVPRVITATVNDGVSDSNTAVSRLTWSGGSGAIVQKVLYLSDPGQGMDRVDPVATNDTTTSSVAVIPIVAPNSTGTALWSDTTTQDLDYRPWNLTSFGTQALQTTDGGGYTTMAAAASATRNETIVAGVTSDRHVSGAIWNGTAWSPIAISIGGTVTQDLGAPSAAAFWGAAVTYETTSGRALLVWNDGTTLKYALWNGTSWTAAAAVAAYTGGEPRQIRLASNPLAGSNEIVLVVSDTNKVDRALVWNGTSWGNQIQLDNNAGHDFTDVAVTYEQISGRAMVTYASGTAGVVAYNLWNGSAWSAAATLSPPAGTSGYARWTVLASDPNSNRIVLGLESNGQSAWMDVWSGSAWGTSALGTANGAVDVANLEIAVAFESKSGDALAVYQNNLAATELEYRTFSGGAWSAATDFGSFGGKVSRGVTLSANPFSDQIMLLANDDGNILRSFLWSGASLGAPVQLESSTSSKAGQPFAFAWDRYVPATVTSSTTFTQTTPMTAPFIVSAGGSAGVTTYIQITSGTLPAAPKLAVALGQGGSPFLTLVAPPAVTALGGGFFKLDWTGSMPSAVTVPAGGQISLTLIDYETSYAFNLLYDSSTYPSQAHLSTSTAIGVSALGVYGTPFPGGSPVAPMEAGVAAYVRLTVADPFGASDVTSADLLITNGLGATVASVTLTDANVVASTAGSKTYELAWTPPAADTFTFQVTAHEGTEGITATAQTTLPAVARPDLSVTVSDGGATAAPGGTVSYTVGFANAGPGAATGVLVTDFLPTGTTFDAGSSTPGWIPMSGGVYRFPVGSLAAGAGGSVVFAVKVASRVPAALEQLEDRAQVSDDGAHGADRNPANNTAFDATPLAAAPDLVLTMTDGGVSTLAGGVVLYQITYANIGTQDATGVAIQETIPANTTFNGTYSSATWTPTGAGGLSFLVGNLAVGASGTVTFAVNVASPLPGGVTQISNTATIADSGASGPDLNPANNTATDATPIASGPQADLQITMTDGVTSVTPGQADTYTVTVTNAGPSGVSGAPFADAVPAALGNVTFTTSVSGGASVAPASGNGNAISALLDLPVGGTVIFTVKGTLAPDATGTLVNLATVLPPAGVTDPNTGNNTAMDEDVVVPVSDLSLTMTYATTDLDGSGTLTPGDRIVFTVRVANTGPSAAAGVSVLDLLPNGYVYVSDDAAGSGGTYAPGAGLWTIGTLGATPPGNAAVLHLTATLAAGGDVTNVAAISASGSFDPNGANNSQSVTPSVQPSSDLKLSGTMTLTSDVDGSGVVSIGDGVTFTLTLSNAGPSAATGVHVTDLLPAGYAFVSATPSQGVYTSATGDWNVGTVNVLGSPTLSLVATVLGGKPAGAYTNYAQVSASGSFDPNSTPGDNSTTEDDDVSIRPPIADLSVTMTAAFAPGGDLDASGTLTVGDQVVFTVTVANAGPDIATGVQLVDALPAGYTYVADDGEGAYDVTTGAWGVGILAPGAARSLHLAATVNPSGPYADTAQVTASGQFDLDSTPNNSVSSEDDQATVTLAPGAPPTAPVAVDDRILSQPPGPATLNVTLNDTDVNLDLAPGTVDLDPATPGRQATFAVPGEGTWSVDGAGNVTFTPQPGFSHDPTPITYVVQDAGGRTSNPATITIDYVPVASNDSASGNTTGTAVTVPVLANDTGGDTPVPATVQIVGTPAPGLARLVHGQGTWSVAAVTGAITFTPQAGFTGDPTPIQYTVQDDDGNTSNAATVSIGYLHHPPVAVNDVSLTNPPGSVTVLVTANDTDSDGDLDPATVDLDPVAPGRQTTRAVAGEGLWTVDDAGSVTFFPEASYTGEPTPIAYVVSDRTGLVSNQATIRIGYLPALSLATSAPAIAEGNPATYTYTITNTSPSSTDPVTITSIVDDHLGDLSATAAAAWLAQGHSGPIVLTPAQSFAFGASTPTALNAGTVVNTASVAGHDDEGTPASASASYTLVVGDAAPALTVAVTGPATALPGATPTYVFTITNTSPASTDPVTITSVVDTVFGDLTATALTAWISQGHSAPIVLARTQAFAFTALTPALPAGTVVNTVTVTGHDDEANVTVATGSHSITVAIPADVALAATVDVASPAAGQNVTFTVTATNRGPFGATGVAVTDRLPAGLTYGSSLPSIGTYDPPTGLWSIGALANGASATLSITATVETTGAVVSKAIKTAENEFDPDASNNVAAVGLNAGVLADVQMHMAVDKPTPSPGTNVTFTLTARNAGPASVTNLIAYDPLPSTLIYVTDSSGGSYNQVTGAWTIGALANAANASITITATVTSGGAITNVVRKTQAEADPEPVNDSSSVTLNGSTTADLAISKSGSPQPAPSGSTISWTIVVLNEGPADATNATVTDPLPAGISGVTAMPSQGTCTGTTTLSCDLGALPAGSAAAITLTATNVVSADLTNRVTVAADQGDPYPTNNSSTFGSWSALRFYVATPCRVLDTRNGTGALGGPALAPGEIRRFDVAGVCAIPATAKVLSLNVTAARPSTSGSLAIFRSDNPTPNIAILPFNGRDTRATNAMTQLTTDGLGSFSLFNGSSGTTHVVIDVNGWFQ